MKNGILGRDCISAFFICSTPDIGYYWSMSGVERGVVLSYIGCYVNNKKTPRLGLAEVVLLLPVT